MSGHLDVCFVSAQIHVSAVGDLSDHGGCVAFFLRVRTDWIFNRLCEECKIESEREDRETENECERANWSKHA